MICKNLLLNKETVELGLQLMDEKDIVPIFEMVPLAFFYIFVHISLNDEIILRINIKNKTNGRHSTIARIELHKEFDKDLYNLFNIQSDYTEYIVNL